MPVSSFWKERISLNKPLDKLGKEQYQKYVKDVIKVNAQCNNEE